MVLLVPLLLRDGLNQLQGSIERIASGETRDEKEWELEREGRKILGISEGGGKGETRVL